MTSVEQRTLFKIETFDFRNEKNLAVFLQLDGTSVQSYIAVDTQVGYRYKNVKPHIIYT